MSNQNLYISSSPHIYSGETVPEIMTGVLIALVPAVLIGIYFFGLAALEVLLISIISAMAIEAGMQKIMGRQITLNDGSAALTGLLLGLTLPASIPWWVIIVGTLIAIVIGKQIYGGLGHNLFNPALIGRAALLISWPVQMTTWVRPTPLFKGAMDAITTATPLGIIKVDGVAKLANISLLDCVLGNRAGAIGEVSAIALLAGGIFLLCKRYITWHIPVGFIFTVGILSGIFWLSDPSKYANPLFHLFNGALILGAFFMATDYVTSPITSKGRLIFGIGCGIMTVLIRLFGVYPEGVAFAILFMNALSPLIDRYTKPVPLGMKKHV